MIKKSGQLHYLSAQCTKKRSYIQANTDLYTTSISLEPRKMFYLVFKKPILWPQWESNPHRTFRKRLFYPLNYGAFVEITRKNSLVISIIANFSKNSLIIKASEEYSLVILLPLPVLQLNNELHLANLGK